MSFNDSKPMEKALLGQKTKAEGDFNSILESEQEAQSGQTLNKEKQSTSKEQKPKCHYCNSDEKSFQNCITCRTAFCLMCIREINEKKDSFKASHSKKNDMNHWICFICLKECPCKKCGFDIKELDKEKERELFAIHATEKKCLICKSNTFLSKIDKKLAQIFHSLSEDKRKELIDKGNEVSLMLIANQKEEKLICNMCLNNNSVVNSFLKGGIDEAESGDNNNNEANEKEKEKNNAIKQLMIDLQSPNHNQQSKQQPTALNENHQSQNQNNQFSAAQNINATKEIIDPVINDNNPYLGLVQQIPPSSQLQPQSQTQVQVQAQQQSQHQHQPMSLSLNMYLPQQNIHGIPNLSLNPFSMMQNNPLPQSQQKQGSPTSLKNSLVQITQIMQNYNNQSIQNNLNVLSNINQLSAILSKISDNKLVLNQNEPNANEKENATMKTIWEIIQNIKTQISITNDFTQIQKGIIIQSMKTLEQSMQQEVNQSLMNEHPLSSLSQINQLNSMNQLMLNTPMNPLLLQNQIGGIDSVYQNLMGKTSFAPQGITQLGLSQNPSSANVFPPFASNPSDKAMQKQSQSPASNMQQSHLIKEDNKIAPMTIQDNKSLMQSINPAEGLQQRDNSNPHYQMGALASNYQMPNYLMVSNPSHQNINNVFQSVALNPIIQPGQIGGIPSYMYNPSSGMPGLNQFQQRIPNMQPGMTMTSSQIPKEAQLNQGINSPSLYQGTLGLPHAYSQIPQEINQMPHGLSQVIPQNMNQGMQSNVMYYMNMNPYMGDQNQYSHQVQLQQYQSILQNPNSINESIVDNKISNLQDDRLQRKKEK